MQTIEETRRYRLSQLVKDHGGLANLCEKLGSARSETAGLARILNGNVRHERGGKPYNMGSPMAREIEATLGLAVGWMDTPAGYAELHADSQISHAMKIMEAMPDEVRDQAVRVLASLAEPALKSGTTDQ